MIHISHFVIIQSLGDGERRTGDEVYQQMVYGSLKAEANGEFKPALLLYDVDSKLRFFNVVATVLQETDKGARPLIHFEMHGTKEGLVLSDNSLITWEELKEPIRSINILSGNNLFIGLATCYGAYFLKHYTIWEPCPFCGYIGAETEVDEKEFEISFSSFYSSLIETGNFTEATKALHQSVPINERIFNYIYCEAYFNMLLDLWNRTYNTPRARQKYIEDSTNNYHKKHPHLSKRFIRELFDRLVTSGKHEKELLTELKDVFLHRRTDGEIYNEFMKTAHHNMKKYFDIEPLP